MESLQEDRPAADIRADTPRDDPHVGVFLRWLDRSGDHPAAEVASWIAGYLGAASSPRRVLDVGGGLGTYGRAMGAALQPASVRIIERPEVMTGAASIPTTDPPGVHVSWRATDFITDDTIFEDEADVILLANVAHLYAPGVMESLVQRAAAALAPGGALLVCDLRWGWETPMNLAARYFALNLVLCTEAGRIHEANAMADWLSRAGLELKIRDLETDPALTCIAGWRHTAGAASGDS